MTNNKKKPSKSKHKHSTKHRGHYCRICGEHKANEKFSGRGHAVHICKACASKSPEQKSEDMTINKLHGMAFQHLSESEIKWLKNRRNDSRNEVSELAKEVFEIRFPRQARNEVKAKLHIEHMLFRIRGDVFDSYGDEYPVNVEYTADASGRIVKKSLDDNGDIIQENSIAICAKAIRKFFNVAVHNYDISFWEIDLCQAESFDMDFDDGFDFDLDEFELGELEDMDDEEFGDTNENDDSNKTEQTTTSGNGEPDNRIPAWGVDIKYKNGTEQSAKGYDFIPDPVLEFLDDIDGYFEEDEPNDEFDESYI